MHCLNGRETSGFWRLFFALLPGPIITRIRLGASMMDAKERYELITRDLQEVLGGEAVMKLCEEGKDIGLYWVRGEAHPP